MIRVDLRTIVMDVPTQDVISRDNVSVKVSAVIYFRVLDPRESHHSGGKPGRGYEPVGPDHVTFGSRAT